MATPTQQPDMAASQDPPVATVPAPAAWPPSAPPPAYSEEQKQATVEQQPQNLAFVYPQQGYPAPPQAWPQGYPVSAAVLVPYTHACIDTIVIVIDMLLMW